MITKTPAQLRQWPPSSEPLCLPPSAAGKPQASVLSSGDSWNFRHLIPHVSKWTKGQGRNERKDRRQAVKTRPASYLTERKVNAFPHRIWGLGAPKLSSRASFEVENQGLLPETRQNRNRVSHQYGRGKCPGADLGKSGQRPGLSGHTSGDGCPEGSIPGCTACENRAGRSEHMSASSATGPCSTTGLPQAHLLAELTKALPQEHVSAKLLPRPRAKDIHRPNRQQRRGPATPECVSV